MASRPIATREARKNPGVNVPLASLLETVAFVSFLNPCFFSRLASPPYVIPALFSSALRYREALSAHSASVIGTHTAESRFALFGLRLLFLVRLDDCLRRTFWRGLH